MVIMGSGTIAQAGLIDEYQVVVDPIVLGKGRTMFEGVKDKLTLKQTKTRTASRRSHAHGRDAQVAAQGCDQSQRRCH